MRQSNGSHGDQFLRHIKRKNHNLHVWPELTRVFLVLDRQDMNVDDADSIRDAVQRGRTSPKPRSLCHKFSAHRTVIKPC